MTEVSLAHGLRSRVDAAKLEANTTVRGRGSRDSIVSGTTTNNRHNRHKVNDLLIACEFGASAGGGAE